MYKIRKKYSRIAVRIPILTRFARDHAKNLQIIHGDVIKVQLPYFDVCVANLPYQVGILPLIRGASVSFVIDFIAFRLQIISPSTDVSMRCRDVSRRICEASIGQVSISCRAERRTLLMSCADRVMNCTADYLSTRNCWQKWTNY